MSNRTNLSKSYNYTVTAASDNSAYLWSGHGLEDAPNPTIYIRSDDDITITNASGGHVMNLSSDDVSWGVTESNGQIVLTSDANLLGEGSYTYVCSSHPAMNGKIKISNPVVNGDPEDGYGTGLLPGNNLGGARASVSVDQIRTKINEIITKGGVGGTPGTGGGSISVSTDAPPSPSDGDLWWDSDTASLYVYFADRDAWIQTNGAVGGSSTAVNVDAEFTANTAHMSGGGGWFCFDDSAANITATIHTNDTSSLSTGNGSGTGTDRAAVFTVPDSGFYQLNASIQLNVNTSTSISLLLHTGDTIPNGSPENLAAAGQVAGENQETLNFSGARYLNAGDKLYFEYTCSSANVPQLKGRLSIFKINAGGGGGGGGGGDASIEVSAAAPDPAEDGDLWFNTTQAELYVYVAAESAWIQTNGGGGSGGGSVYDTKWITCSPSTSGIGKYMDFSHNLGEQPNNITVLLSGSATGEDAWEAHHILLDTNNNNIYGYQASEIGNSTMRIWMSAYGVQEHKGAAWSGDPSSNGASSHDWGSGNAAYVRVIATVGGGGGAGPRAHVSFDGTTSATTPTIYNSFNVSSVTDKGSAAGSSVWWNVNLTTPVANPIIQFSVDSLYSGTSPAYNFNAVHHGYHIVDDSTITFYIYNYSGGGVPDSSFNHWSVAIF